jgi:hypothetical protein
MSKKRRRTDMGNFWKWMVFKDYGLFDKDDIYIKVDSQIVADPPKQMLIGYMQEYLAEGTGKITCKGAGVILLSSTEDRYNWLKKKIESKE